MRNVIKKNFLELNCNIKPRDELIAGYIQYSWICIDPNVLFLLTKVRVISWIKYSNHEWYRVSCFSKSFIYIHQLLYKKRKLRCEIFGFCPPLVLSKQKNLALLSLYTFGEKVFIFQLFNNKIYIFCLT